MIQFNSPLRYPGGKHKLAQFIAAICLKNNINGHYVEPYAGGAAISLYLLFYGYVKEITINDLDRSVFAFWHSILNHNKKFCNRIRNTDVTLENWDRFREIQTRKESASIFELGFSTFFLNRTNRSGIMCGGVIGGRNQDSNYTIGCRFNKDELIQRIQRIGKFKDKIHLFNLDAMNLVKKIQAKHKDENMIFYFDPPYYMKGPSLYLDHYKKSDHGEVARNIQKIKGSKWITSYDNAPEIKNIYNGCIKKEYSLFHTAYRKHKSMEVLFFSKNLNSDVPLEQLLTR